MNLYRIIILLLQSIYSYLFIILLICSCTNSKSDKNDNINSILIKDSDLNKKYKLSEIIDSVLLIPLETNDSCLIGNISKILMVGDTICILDGKVNRILYFDKQGKFISAISHMGRAPFEYLSLDDFCRLNNGNIAVINSSIKKLIIYNSKGEGVDVQKLPFFADALEQLNDSILVFNGSSFEDRIILWNYKQQRIINSYIKYDKRFSRRILKPFTKYGEEVFWRQNFHSELFKVDENKLYKVRKVDFGKHSFKGEVVQGAMGLYILPSNVAEIYYYTETPNYIVFRFSCEDLSENPYFVFHSKNSKQNIVLNEVNFIDDMIYYPTPPQVVIDAPEERFISILTPSFWFNYLEKEELHHVKHKNFNILKEQIKNIHFSDNPVIAIYTLKPF